MTSVEDLEDASFRRSLLKCFRSVKLGYLPTTEVLEGLQHAVGEDVQECVEEVSRILESNVRTDKETRDRCIDLLTDPEKAPAYIRKWSLTDEQERMLHLEKRMRSMNGLQKQVRHCVKQKGRSSGGASREFFQKTGTLKRIFAQCGPTDEPIAPPESMKDKLASLIQSQEGISSVCRMRTMRVLKSVPRMRQCLKVQRRQTHELYNKLASQAAHFMESVENKAEVLRQRDERERLKALRQNDLSAYKELVRHTKNSRINELLNQTDSFLDELKTKMVAASKIIVKEKGRRAKKQADVEEPKPEEEAPILGGLHSEEDLVGQPAILKGGELMHYQIVGLNFLASLYKAKLSGILADEMGLGKTIQTIAFLAYLRESEGVHGPHLIIVPLSTLPNWLNELERWCPTIRAVAFRGSREEREDIGKKIRTRNFDVCVTTFDFTIREKVLLARHTWKSIIVDEGHRLKNFKSKLHVTLSSDFRGHFRLLLTGTPIQNTMKELWSLLNFVLPTIFSSADNFDKWFNEPFSDLPGNEGSTDLNEEEQLLIINRLHETLRPFLLRRMKSEVLGDLPAKRDFIIRMNLTPWQDVLCKNIATGSALLQVSSGGQLVQKSVQNMMMELRKAVNHPYLFVDEYLINEDLYRVSGKFEVLDRMIPKLLHFNHKILIFCQMTQLMSILEDYLSLSEVKYHRLDGSMAVADRQERVDHFNKADSDVNVFMLSTRAGGLGINLQAADTVIIFDSDWNPHQDLQAQSRAHRVGQLNEVRVFRLVTISPIEESVLMRAEHKMTIDQKVIEAGMFKAGYSEQERQHNLRLLLDAEKALKRDVSVTSLAELNRYMARSEEEEIYFHEWDALRVPRPAKALPKRRRRPAVKSDVESSDGEDLDTLLKKANRIMEHEEVPDEFNPDSKLVKDFMSNSPKGRNVGGLSLRKRRKIDERLLSYL